MSSSIRRRKTTVANRDIVSPIQRFSSKKFKPKTNGILLILWLDDQKRIKKFELSGHAGFGEEGSDIICAGVSALSIAAVNGLEHFLKNAPDVKESDGYLTCTLREVTEQEFEKSQWILQTMRLGIEEIQKTYGEKYIKIDLRRWTPC